MKYLILLLSATSFSVFGDCLEINQIFKEMEQSSVEYELISVSSYQSSQLSTVNPLLLQTMGEIDKFTFEQRHLTKTYSALQKVALSTLVPSQAMAISCRESSSRFIDIIRHSKNELIFSSRPDQLNSDSAEEMSLENRYALKLKRLGNKSTLELTTLSNNTPYIYYYLNARRDNIDLEELQRNNFQSFQIIREKISW